ncbi:MAG: NAD-dependent succinate-semialdehyde dehydrogenase [Desulfovibrio sp.]|jgi:succinate-semialdehyde dehydrogenase/glutarate-semialdehyde dehydrogenase|nr:NAD-dependent succinate-semialdehyde dehydrogenase [Desulfovibrio sp.]
MRLKDNNLFKQQCFVGGKWVSAADGAVITVTNPADDSVVGAVPKLGRKEIAEAVDAAEKAWAPWKSLRPLQRSEILRRWHSLIAENIDDLAMIMTMEQGKPLAEARGEIMLGMSYITWYAEEGRRVYGETIPSPWAGKQPMTIRQPIGVTAAITPWNFPMSMIARKASPALAAGCPMIIKPASMTPFSALAMAELAARAGVPAGILSVVTGDAAVIGEELCANAKVRKLTFTGSTEVGKKLMAGCASTVKKLSMELGGNAPMIVCADADIKQAVAGTMGCKFRNAGQTCICVNRLIVHENVHDQFVAGLVEQAKAIVTGNGLEAGVTQGPMITSSAFAAMQTLVDDAVAKGAKIALGGKADPKGGRLYLPTVLTDVTPEMRVFREEIFGPIAPVIRFKTEKEALELANDTEYGLASYVYTRDLGSFYRIAEALDYGMVGVNEVALAAGEVPFGGVKFSGLGREGGRQGIEDYMETKYILLGGLAS